MQEIVHRVDALGGKNLPDSWANSFHVLHSSGGFEHLRDVK